MSGAEKSALAADKTDNRAAMGREGTPPQAALEVRDHEALIDTARVEERKPKRPRLRSFLARIRHTAEPTTAHQAFGRRTEPTRVAMLGRRPGFLRNWKIASSDLTEQRDVALQRPAAVC